MCAFVTPQRRSRQRAADGADGCDVAVGPAGAAPLVANTTLPQSTTGRPAGSRTSWHVASGVAIAPTVGVPGRAAAGAAGGAAGAGATSRPASSAALAAPCAEPPAASPDCPRATAVAPSEVDGVAGAAASVAIPADDVGPADFAARSPPPPTSVTPIAVTTTTAAATAAPAPDNAHRPRRSPSRARHARRGTPPRGRRTHSAPTATRTASATGPGTAATAGSTPTRATADAPPRAAATSSRHTVQVPTCAATSASRARPSRPSA